jgi:hypothetical protein
MKLHVGFALPLLLSFISMAAFSQNNNGSKPRQFGNFPDIINCSEAELEKIFTSAAGQNISISFSDNFSFNGSVTGNVVKYDNLRTAVIRSPYFNNSIFSLSKIINKDNSVSYTGRIINKEYFDGYELKRNANGKYQLVKMETDRVIQDCRQR